MDAVLKLAGTAVAELGKYVTATHAKYAVWAVMGGGSIVKLIGGGPMKKKVQLCEECGVQPGFRLFGGKWICQGGNCAVAAGKLQLCEECGKKPGFQRFEDKWICGGGDCKAAAGGARCCRPGCMGPGKKLWKYATNGEKTCQKLGCINYKAE